MPKHPWHLSPTSLALASAAGGLLLTLFPPALYESLIGERDQMFGDWRLIGFIATCVSAFIVGAHFSQGKTSARRSVDSTTRKASSQSARWAISLAIAVIVLVAIVIASLASEIVGIIYSLASGSAAEFRTVIFDRLVDTGFSPISLLTLGLPLIYWATAGSLVPATDSLLAARSAIFVRIATAVFVLCLMITLQRGILMPFVIGLVCLFSGVKWHRHGVNARRIFKLALLMVGALIFTFVLISYFRSGSEDSPWMLLVGYVPASYNRLSFALSGSLTPDVQAPYYTFRLIWHPPLIRRLFPMNEFGVQWGLPIPDTIVDGYLGEFSNVLSSGLNPIFIWPTAYGYAFFDLQWLSPAYFFLIGCLSGFVWKRFLDGRIFGLVVYPYIAASILLWSTDNFLSIPPFAVVLLVGGIASVLGVGGRKSYLDS